MGKCVRCGCETSEGMDYACVVGETEICRPEGGKDRKKVTRETLTEIVHKSVCPECARKAKIRATLMTIPITLGATAVLTVLSMFTARPNRNIRKEIASMPVVLPIVAVVLLLCGLSVYLPRPKELYGAEIVRKSLSLPGNAFLLPLNRRCYTRRTYGELKAEDIRHRSPARTELAEKIIPLIEGRMDNAAAQALVGQTFVLEERVR